MEKSTITIEIKQEVSILLLWIVGGIFFVSLAFFIPSRSSELWPRLYAGGSAAILYLGALLVYTLRKPVSRKARVIAVVCFVILLGAFILSSVQSDLRAHRQIENLMQVRGLIGRGIMLSKMPQPLLKTLQIYYRQGSSKKETLAQIFQRLNNNAAVGINIYRSEFEGDSLKTFIQTLEPQRVVLVSQETYVKGRDPEFTNYNGQKGMIQEKCSLTERGLKYESEN